jgi:putative membrane-bound dehydrogenase-like protein
MQRLVLASVLLLVLAWLVFAEQPAAPATHQVELNGHTFTLPAGFDIELVAGPPLVDRPITADFDEQGRLYVADSSGSNEKVEVQLEKKPHRIVRLEDTDGDGRFDKSVVFADKMMFPEGTMWLAGSLYVSAAPSIWKLTDTDGDGVADQRVEWFQGKTLTGCANDLHGPYRGPDGWVYWCKGAFAKQTYERPLTPQPPLPPRGEGEKDRSPLPAVGEGSGVRGKPFVTRAAHIFRCRPDGSGIEPVMTGGMDNPVDVVFTPGGERVFTTTFFQHPGGGKRDGLIHAVYGGVYGKDHDVIYDHKWTGPDLMPVLSHLGAAAPCGLTRYESGAFGPDYRDNLFACLFNMHKVTRHVLEKEGATFKSRDEDFLVSSNLDFHPTDVLEDADGSLLVIDTGGWYKLCCPTSQLHKPDVLGAIYRIRRHDAPRVEDPRGLKLAWAGLLPTDLARLLDDPRPAVRHRAIETLAAKGAAAVPAIAAVLRGGHPGEAKRNAVWAATRIDQPSAREAVRTVLMDSDGTVRQAALHSVSLWRDREAVAALVSLLHCPAAHTERAAAEALGRIGDKSAVPALLEAAGRPGDRVLEHSLTYALIEIADREGTAAGLKSDNVRTRRAALVALDQMEGGGLEAATVAAELTSKEPVLKETAAWIAGRHPDWGDALAGFLRDRLAAKELPEPERAELAGQLARFSRSPAVQTMLAERLVDTTAPQATRVVVLHAMARSGMKEAPDAWVAALTQALSTRDADVLRESVGTARALAIPRQKAGPLTAKLLEIGGNESVPATVRLTALDAVPGGLAEVPAPLFALLRAQLDQEHAVADRTLAADVLAHGKLSSEQLIALTEAFKSVTPMEVDRLLEAYVQSTDDRVGLALLAALKATPIRSSLRVDQVKTRLAKYSPKVQQQAEELYAALNVDLAKQQAKLEEMLGALGEGDVRRGQAVFNGTKAACSSCHAIGYLGGNVGPDLTHIAKTRSERDLLEAIVFPSASFVRSYEPMKVTTKSGKVYNGLVRKDTPEEIVLQLNATDQVRIARDDIDEVEPSKVSIMPAGLDQQLTQQELADLVAFLKTCK